MKITKLENSKLLTVYLFVTVAILVPLIALFHTKQVNVKAHTIKLPDPAGMINLFPGLSMGELAYVSSSYSTIPNAHFVYHLVIHKTGQPNQIETIEHSFIPAASSGMVGCDFSPDGRNILVKLSAPSVPLDVYNILVWNRITHHMQPGPMGLRYVPTYWSLDGSHFAYLQGGDLDGREVLEQGDQNQDDPISLSVYDIATGESHLAARHPVLNSMAWWTSNRLLYSQTVHPMPLLFMRLEWADQPNIYSYSISNGLSTQLLSYGFNPAASPNGKNIAFVGWPAPVKQAEKHQAANNRSSSSKGYGIYLYDAQQKTRSLIYALKAPNEWDQLLWAPDNKHLLLLRVLYRVEDYPGYGEGHFALINTVSKETKELAVVKTVDAQFRLNPATLFQLRGFSKTDKSLVFSTSEVRKQGSYDRLCRLNLANGSVQELYHGSNLSGVGWHE